ncbi:hypothetical protein [Paraburkholderia phytofirmans]|uniref:hypothetical protein n=1 Tax=Paraburkholderia phytofirmans TaxID=261302 RepID=UPI0038B9FABD
MTHPAKSHVAMWRRQLRRMAAGTPRKRMLDALPDRFGAPTRCGADPEIVALVWIVCSFHKPLLLDNTLSQIVAVRGVYARISESIRHLQQRRTTVPMKKQMTRSASKVVN